MRKLFLFGMLCVFIVSCSKETMDRSDYDRNLVSSTNEIMVFDNSGDISFLNGISPSENALTKVEYGPHVKVSDQPFQENGLMELRKAGVESGGPFTLIGYTDRELVQRGIKISFMGDNPKNLNGVYLHDLYKYYYRVVIPHGATLIIPPAPTNYKNMGTTTYGYKYTYDGKPLGGYFPIAGPKSASGDTYFLTTYVWIITHNILGQSVGPYYFPFEFPNSASNNPAIKDPNTFIFKYAWSNYAW